PHAIHGAAVVAAQSRQLANLIASHHSGLHDETDTLADNLNKLTQTESGKSLLHALLSAYKADALPSLAKPSSSPLSAQGTTTEDLHLRLLLSALVDADYLDTESHFLNARGKSSPAPSSATPADLLAKLDA